MERLQNEKHRSTTKATYHAIWTSFNSFLTRLDVLPKSWEERLSIYITHLIIEGAKSSTIKSYVSAIRSVLRDDGYELMEPKLLFTSLTRACRLNNDRVLTRLPIHRSLLDLILFEVQNIYENENPQIYLSKLYQCMFLLGYYGLLRIGEMASGTHPVKAKDIHTSEVKQKILLVLFTSKTHGVYAHPQKIKIWADTHYKASFCPFKVTHEFLTQRGDYLEDHEPLFVFGDRSPVRPAHFRKSTQKSTQKIGARAQVL